MSQGSYLSAVQNSGNLSQWDDVTDLRHSAEEAHRALYEKLIDDRHILENRIRILERKLREANGNRR